LTVHVWNNSTFVPLKDTSISLIVNNMNLRIVNVISADFNHNGHLDVVLMGMDPKNSNDIHLSLFNGNAKDSFGNSRCISWFSFTSHSLSSRQRITTFSIGLAWKHEACIVRSNSDQSIYTMAI
jgi:hypothetical protein